MKLVCGVGFNDRKYPKKENGKVCKIYTRWVNMLSRCYDERYREQRPTYLHCTTSEGFKNYSFFREWFCSQIGSDDPRVNLDKDLLVRGNKVYSEDTCLLLPPLVNNQIIKSDKIRGDLPIGVYFNKNKNLFKAQIKKNGKKVQLCLSDDPMVCFNAYKEEKERYLKDIAKEYRDKIDPRAYHALMNYSVEITD